VSRGDALEARLRRVESRNVTWLGGRTLFWDEASGTRVTDSDGNRYLDFTGAFGVAFAGHRHPRIVRRIAGQSQRLIHGMGDVHPPIVKVEFLEALAAVMPWPDTKTILGTTGSDAVEAALKTAQLATGKAGIVAFRGGYHGLALGALAATHRRHFRHPFTARLTDHVRFLTFPTTAQQADRVLAELPRALAAGPFPAGAVLVEPVQGRAGVKEPPPDFLRRLAKRSRAEGALLVADEVFTGMGRTGSLLASSPEALPDLVCVGKALGGGLPLSACCGPAAVMDSWPPSSGEAIHTSTFLGHPLACAAGLAFLDVLAEEELAARAARLGEQAVGRLRSVLAGCGSVREVRGRGLMIGVELCQDRTTAAAVAARALAEGLIVLPAGDDGQVVELTPPATITGAELEQGLEALARAVRSAS